MQQWKLLAGCVMSLLFFLFVLGSPSPVSAQTLAVTDFISYQTGDVRRFLEFDAERNHQGLSVEVERVLDPQLVNGLEAIVIEEGGVGGSERSFVVIDADGLKLLREEETDPDVVVEYDPPLLLLPARLEIGATVTHMSSFVETEEEEDEQLAGTITRSITPLLLIERVTVTAGTFETALLVEVRERFQEQSEPMGVTDETGYILQLLLLAANKGVVATAEAEVEFGDEGGSDIELEGRELLDATLGGELLRPLSLTVTASAPQVSSGETVQLRIDTRTAAAPISADLYDALLFPDGRFSTFTETGTLSNFGSVVPHRRSVVIDGQGIQEHLSLQTSNQFPRGTYTLFAVLTPSGANALNSENWIAIQTATFLIQ